MISLNRSVVALVALALALFFLQHVNAGGAGAALSGLRNTAFYVLPAFLIGIVLHEWAHAYVAWKLGDPTGRNLGRLSLNPLVHLDPLGTLMMVVVGFGWANPVPIVTRNFRNPRRDTALAAGAGPLMNLLIAGVAVVAVNLLPAYRRDPMVVGPSLSAFAFLVTLAQVNALLAVFNLIPVKPLDGHHFLEVMLPPRWYWSYKRNEMMISAVALVLLFLGAFNPVFHRVQSTVYGLCVTSYWGVS
jgi:Zn-dependent protease